MENYLIAFLPIIAFAINIISQICISRYLKNFGLLKSVIAGFAIGLLSLLFIEIFCMKLYFLPLKNIFSIIADTTTYFCLGYVYFHFINLGETARRIRLLRELYDSKEGLNLEEILSRYNAKEIIQKRINRLIDSRQIILKDDKYYIANPIMLLTSKFILMLKLILLGKKSEFD